MFLLVILVSLAVVIQISFNRNRLYENFDTSQVVSFPLVGRNKEFGDYSIKEKEAQIERYNKELRAYEEDIKDEKKLHKLGNSELQKLIWLAVEVKSFEEWNISKYPEKRTEIEKNSLATKLLSYFRESDVSNEDL